MICLIVWGAIYSMLDIYLYSTFSIKNVIVAIWHIFSNHTGYHLWYLFALIALYLIVPVFKIIVSHTTKRQLAYIILLWMILSLGVDQFNYIMKSLNMSITLDWYFPMITSWAGYFFLGYFLYNYDLKEKYEITLIIIGFITLFVSSVLNLLLSWHLNTQFNAFIPQNGFTACISSISVFLLFKRIGESKKNNKASVILTCFSDKVFGIYLIHVLINSVIFHIMEVKIDFINPVVSIPILSVIVFFISYVLVWGLKRIRFIRKTVV